MTEYRKTRLADIYDTFEPTSLARSQPELEQVIEPKSNFISGALGQVYEGSKDTVRSLGSTVDVYQGDTLELGRSASLSGQNKTEQLKAFEAQASSGDDTSLWQELKNIIGAVRDHPSGFLHFTARQAPNSAVAIASMVTGARTGAALGSAFGPAGTVVGGIAGTALGMFLGNTALETGAMAQEGISQNPDMSSEEVLGYRAKGAKKGATISAIDSVSMGVNRYLGGAVGKRLNDTIVKELSKQGVDITNGAAIKAAMGVPSISDSVMLAANKSLRTGNLAAKAGGFGLDIISEGTGEYAGQVAAGEDASINSALLEAFSSMPQSGIEVAFARSQGNFTGKETTDVLNSESGGDLQKLIDSGGKRRSLAQALVDNGIARPSNSRETAEANVKAFTEAASTNPATLQPLQSAKVKQLALAMARAKKGMEVATLGASNENLQKAYDRYEAELKRISAESENPVEKEEASQVLAGPQEQPIETPTDTVEEVEEDTPNNIATKESQALTEEYIDNLNTPKEPEAAVEPVDEVVEEEDTPLSFEEIESAFKRTLDKGGISEEELLNVYAKNYPEWAVNRETTVQPQDVETVPEHVDVAVGDVKENGDFDPRNIESSDNIIGSAFDSDYNTALNDPIEQIPEILKEQEGIPIGEPTGTFTEDQQGLEPTAEDLLFETQAETEEATDTSTTIEPEVIPQEEAIQADTAEQVGSDYITTATGIVAPKAVESVVEDTVDLFHGTHQDNIDSITRVGISLTDGKVFTTPKSDVAFGYAVMNGESQYSGLDTPEAQRAVLTLKIPKSWYDKHVIKENLGTSTPEVSFDTPIPPEFITSTTIGKSGQVQTSESTIEDTVEPITEDITTPKPLSPTAIANTEKAVESVALRLERAKARVERAEAAVDTAEDIDKAMSLLSTAERALAKVQREQDRLDQKQARKDAKEASGSEEQVDPTEVLRQYREGELDHESMDEIDDLYDDDLSWQYGTVSGWHGSSSYYEKVDHSYLSSGVGNQAFGWGTYISSSRSVAEWFRDQVISARDQSKGYVYKMDVNHPENSFLWWDKSIESQSPEVREAIRVSVLSVSDKTEGWLLYRQLKEAIEFKNPTGTKVLEALGLDISVDYTNQSAQIASGYLDTLGIKGTRYTTNPNITNRQDVLNYVVFNDENVTITDQYSWSNHIPNTPTAKGTSIVQNNNGTFSYKHSPEVLEGFKAIVNKYDNGAVKVGKRIFLVDSYLELPKHVQQRMLQAYKQSKGKMIPERFGAVIDNNTGDVYVVGSAAANTSELTKAVIHELVGHAGMKSMFDTLSGDQNGYNTFLTREAKRNKSLMKEAVTMVYTRGYANLFSDTKSVEASLPVRTPDGVKYVSESGMQTILDEYIAFNAEDVLTNPDLQSKYGSLRRRLVAVIKHALRKLGIGSGEMTIEDMYSLIIESNMRLFDPSRSVAGILQAGRGPRYQITKYTDIDSPHFKIEAAAIAGVSPRGSYALELKAAEEWEATKSKKQREFYKAKESQHDKDLKSMVDLVLGGFGAVEGSYLERFGTKLWDKVKDTPVMQKLQKYGAALGNVPLRKAYQSVNHRALGHIKDAEQIAKSTSNILNKLNAIQKKQVMDYFTTRDADKVMMEIPVLQRNVLEKAKNTLMAYGDELVTLGLLDPQKHAETRGMYLPRVYFKYLRGNASGPSGKRISFMGYLRKQQDMPREEQVELGKFEDPSIIIPEAVGTLGRDIALYRMTQNIIDVDQHISGGWILGTKPNIAYSSESGRVRNVSFYQLEEERERITGQISDGVDGEHHRMSAEDLSKLQDHLAYITNLIELNKDARAKDVITLLKSRGISEEEITPAAIEKFMQDNYKEMPRDKAYGKLSGVTVLTSIRSDFVDSVRSLNLNPEDTGMYINDKTEMLHQMWKTAKVPLNPPSWVRNIIGNLVLLDTSSNKNLISSMVDVTSELQQLVSNGGSRFWKMGEEYGLLGTTFASNELNLIIRSHGKEIEQIIKLRELENKTGIKALLTKQRIKAAKGFMSLLTSAANAYGGQEGIFKVVKLKQQIEAWEKQNKAKYPKGIDSLSATERDAVIMQAAIEADRTIFNYQEIPQWMRWARRAPFLGSPFITFTYKSALRFPEMTIKHPAKTAAWIAVTSTTVSSVLTSLFGGDWDEEEAQQALNTLSEYYETNPAIMILPWKDDKGNIQYTDLSPTIPHAQHLQLMANMHKGLTHYDKSQGALDIADSLMAWAGFGGAPLLSIPATILTQTDSFTGRKIYPTGASGKEKLEAWGTYLVNQIMPSWFSERGAVGHLLNNANIDLGPLSSGREFNRSGNDIESAWQAASRMTGMNVNSVDLEDQRRNTITARDSKLRELAIRRNAIARDHNISPEDRAAKLSEINTTRKHILEKYQGKLN